MKCPYCTEEIQDDAVKCIYCGKALYEDDLPNKMDYIEQQGEGLLKRFGLWEWFQSQSTETQQLIERYYIKEQSGSHSFSITITTDNLLSDNEEELQPTVNTFEADVSELYEGDVEETDTSPCAFLARIAGAALYENLEFSEYLYKEALKQKGSPIDRHFIYLELHEFYYRQRAKLDRALEKSTYYCLKDIEEFPVYSREFKKIRLECVNCGLDLGYRYEDEARLPSYECRLCRHINDSPKEIKGVLPRIPSFERLAIIYEKLGDYEKALEVVRKEKEAGIIYPKQESRIKRMNKNKEKQEKGGNK